MARSTAGSFPSCDIWSASCQVGLLYFCEMMQLLVVIVLSGFAFGAAGCGGVIVATCVFSLFQSVPAGLPGALDVLCPQLWESDPSSPVPALFLRRCLVLGFGVSLGSGVPLLFVTPSFVGEWVLGGSSVAENENHPAMAQFAAELLQSLWVLLPLQNTAESLKRFLLARDEGREATITILTSWSVAITVLHAVLCYFLILRDKRLTGITIAYVVTTILSIVVYFIRIVTTSDRGGNTMLLKGGGFIPYLHGAGDRGYRTITNLCVPGIVGIMLVRAPFEISPLAAGWLTPSRVVFQGLSVVIYKMCFSIPLIVSQAITLTAGRAISCANTDKAKGVVKAGLLLGLLVGPMTGLIFTLTHTVIMTVIGIPQMSGAVGSASCFALIDALHSCCVGILRGTSTVSHPADSSRRLVSHIQSLPFVVIFPVALIHFSQFGVSAHWWGLAAAQTINIVVLLRRIQGIPWSKLSGTDLVSEYTPLNPTRKSGRITPSYS